MTLTVSDLGDPPRSATSQLKVKVTDVNDVAPRWSCDLYEGHVTEERDGRALVVRVQAEDEEERSDGGEQVKVRGVRGQRYRGQGERSKVKVRGQRPKRGQD